MRRERRAVGGMGWAAAAVSGLLSCAACADFLLTPEPGDSPVEVARAAWSEIDAYYPFFAEKNIDWDSVGDEHLKVEAAVGRFIDRRAHYRTHRFKAGPAHDDFGPDVRDYIEPTGRQRYHGPMVVLQNRSTFSSAEDFVLAMRVRPNVTFVGDSTGGGAGNPIGRELPNGWLLKVSRWQAWAADGTFYEGIGLAPDVLQDISQEDLAAGRDAILERAVALLISRTAAAAPRAPAAGTLPRTDGHAPRSAPAADR